MADQDKSSACFYNVESRYRYGYELRYPETVESNDLWEPFRQLTYLSREAGYEERMNIGPLLADENSAADYLLYILAVDGVDNVIQNTYFFFIGRAPGKVHLPALGYGPDLRQRVAGEPAAADHGELQPVQPVPGRVVVTNNLLTKGGSGFTSLLQTRYRELRRQVLAEDTLIAAIDAYERQLTPPAY